VVCHGTPLSSGSSGTEGFVILNENLEQLESPFPFFTGLTGVRKLFEELFNKKTEKDHFEKLVTRLNGRLFKFYGEAAGSY
jgi:hypothetical protein